MTPWQSELFPGSKWGVHFIVNSWNWTAKIVALDISSGNYIHDSWARPQPCSPSRVTWHNCTAWPLSFSFSFHTSGWSSTTFTSITYPWCATFDIYLTVWNVYFWYAASGDNTFAEFTHAGLVCRMHNALVDVGLGSVKGVLQRTSRSEHECSGVDGVL